jgi:hypothetical protein
MAVVATLNKGYDLEYIWKQVDRGPAKDAASYYIQASEIVQERVLGKRPESAGVDKSRVRRRAGNRFASAA